MPVSECLRCHVLRVYLLLQSLALAILLTWPIPMELSERAIGSLDGDGIKHVWNLWWMRQEVLSGVPGLHTNWVGFPDGMDLYPIEPLNGLFAAVLPLEPVALSNILAIVHLTLLGLCSGWLGEIVSYRMRGALMAGALAQCSAFAAFTLHVGVGELRELWWLPLGFSCLLEAQQTRHWKWFAALGGVLVLSVLSCFYMGFFLAIGVLVYALVTLRRNTALLTKYTVTAVVSSVIALAPFQLFARTYDPYDDRASLTFEQWKTTRPLETYEAAATEPSQLLLWRNAERTSDRQARAYTGGRYLGLITLGLAIAGAWAQPRRAAPWLAVAATGIVLSFGTVLWEHGKIITFPGGARMVLPLAWINAYLGYYAEPVNFPTRFLALAAVALPAAAAAATRWRWTWVLVPLACLDMISHDLVPWPRETFALPNTAGLTNDGSELGVLNVTPFLRLQSAEPGLLLANKDSEGRSRAISAQITMQRRFDIIPIERMDFWSPDGLLWALPLPVFQAIHGHPARPNVEQYRRDLWLVRDRGFDKLLITFAGQLASIAESVNFLTDLCGEPEQSAVAVVWTVPTVNATADEAATWKAGHAALVAALPRPRMGKQFPSTTEAPSSTGVPPPPDPSAGPAPVSIPDVVPPPPADAPPSSPSPGVPPPPGSGTIQTP